MLDFISDFLSKCLPLILIFAFFIFLESLGDIKNFDEFLVALFGSIAVSIIGVFILACVLLAGMFLVMCLIGF